jgi:opacity protein-like surface antigen
MKIYILIILTIFSANTNAKINKVSKLENRFSFSAGNGLSYSIMNNKLVDGEDITFSGLTILQKKKSLGFNLFGEISCMFRKNFYITAGLDYNQFSRSFSSTTRFYSPYYTNEISFDYYGRLIDRNFSIQFTINKKFTIKKNSIHIGTGIFFINTIEPQISIGFQPPPYQTNFAVSERKNWEFGLPIQLCYEYAINDKWNIGLKSQFQYILSTQNSQNIYFSPYFRLNIQKMEKRNKSNSNI